MTTDDLAIMSAGAFKIWQEHRQGCEQCRVGTTHCEDGLRFHNAHLAAWNALNSTKADPKPFAPPKTNHRECS